MMWDGVGWPVVLREPEISQAQSTVRRNHRCPHCGYFASVFFAKTVTGAMYRCMKILGKYACGRYFDGPPPEPWRP